MIIYIINTVAYPLQVEYFDVGSPVTNKYYLQAPKGEIYGLEHDVKRFGSPDCVMTLRPETDIPGLVLTGRYIREIEELALLPQLSSTILSYFVNKVDNVSLSTCMS